MDFVPKTYGYYMHLKRKQMKLLFSKLARKLNLDPLKPSHWYSFPPSSLRTVKVNKKRKKEKN